jgi:GPI mannosyltransferase 3
MKTVARHPLAVLLLLAAALRVAMTWGASVHHPDEVFQYLEQAHRLVFGYGYVPWEYRDRMRSWLVPGLLAGPMWLGNAIGAHVLLPRLTVAVATLGVVWGAWSLGRRVSRLHALLAGFVAAVWFDGVYFASHTLTETIATAAAMAGIALLSDDPSRKREESAPLPLAGGVRGGRLLLAGALLAFAALVRFHYAPALALLVAWRCRLDARAWGAVIAGALPVLALSALVDLAAGTTPFGWVEANYRRNVIDNASATYGVSGPLFYLAELRRWWRWALMPLVFLAIFGAQRYPQLLAAALLTVALHMAIGHKELRFILLAMTLLVILAALGTATLVEMARTHRREWTAAAFAGWAAASLVLALSGEMRWRWSEGSAALETAALAGRDPKLCGLATYDMRYWQSGGWTYLGRDVPIYPVTARDELGVPPMDPATLARVSPGFDAILTTPAGEGAMPPGYARVACRIPGAPFASRADRAARRICLYRRPGGCDAQVAAAWRLR